MRPPVDRVACSCQPRQRCDRNRLPSRFELHVRIDVPGDWLAALCRHLFGCPHHLRAGSRVPGTGGAGVRRHDRRRSRSATQRFPLCLLYSCRLSRAACHRGPGLAGGDDGSGRHQRLSRDCGAASALLFTVLACARHRLGMAVHGGLSVGSPFMTDTQYDRAPGDPSALPDVEQGTSSGVLVYTIGLALAVVFTAMSFWVANTSLLWAGGISLGLTVLAIAQMGVHLVFFLHVTTGPDNTNNVMALAFGVLIVALVVVGSLLIMADLNDNMMPAAELMNLQMQH